MRLKKAIEEEFAYKNVEVDDFVSPDWGELAVLSYDGLGQDEVFGDIEVIKLARY
jgi:hypothetical protein